MKSKEETLIEIGENNGDITVAENKIKDLEFYPNYDAEIIEVGLGKKRVDAQIFFDADGRDYILINDKINYVDDLEISSTYAEGGEIEREEMEEWFYDHDHFDIITLIGLLQGEVSVKHPKEIADAFSFHYEGVDFPDYGDEYPLIEL